MKNILRELAVAARGSQNAESRNLVFIFSLNTGTTCLLDGSKLVPCSARVLHSRRRRPKSISALDSFVVSPSDRAEREKERERERERGERGEKKKVAMRERPENGTSFFPPSFLLSFFGKKAKQQK